MSGVTVLAGGTVIDGSGKPGYRADLAISGSTIARVGEVPRDGARVIDVGGLVLAPGFIDSHTHTDGTAFRFPLAESKLLQGVTSEVTGNCGIGFFPVAERTRGMLEGYLEVHEFAMPDRLDWTDFAGYAGRLGRAGLGLNHIPLVAHGALRIAVMGAEDRAPTAAEQAEMNRLLAACLQQGAWGLSTGLIYPPGSYAMTDELVALAEVLARHEAVYTSHIRGESGTLIQAVDEAIEIGRRAKARVVISHLKPLGQDNWGKGALLLEKIAQARREGVDVTADQYPYEASSTSLTALVPARFHAGGIEALLAALADETRRADLLAGIEREMAVRGGPDRVMVAHLGSGRAELSGKTLAWIAAHWRKPAAETVRELLCEEKAAVGAVFFSISEQDVETIIQSPLVAVGSDGRGMCAGAVEAATHPRSYGTFPRVLGRYVRDKGLLPLELAIHKMTGLTAERFGLRDRGLIAPGLAADIVVFDPATIADASDFSHPHRYATGVRHLFVNGVQAVADGQVTGSPAGRVLSR